MKTLEFFQKQNIHNLIKKIQKEIQKRRKYFIMEFCGGHTHSLLKYGIVDLLPEEIEMIHGPGCPVCVMPIERIDLAIELAKQSQCILCTYGDLLRVPGSNRKSLLHLRSEGYDIRMVYSCLETIEIAKKNPNKEIIFFSIGFETTTPPTAILIKTIEKENIKNLSVVSNHVLTPSAIQHILNSPELREMHSVPIDAFIGPGHVSTIIGYEPYEYFVEEFQKPVAISGFEPEDLLLSILFLIRSINNKNPILINELSRFVTREGNLKAKTLVSDVFELRKEFKWRGLGLIPYSALQIQKKYSKVDAEKKFQVLLPKPKENKACICGFVLRGLKKPTECPIFGKICTPENPMGSCMVSSEGACAAYYLYKNFNQNYEKNL
ncbi:MAG: hydrogenase formation protein HypD [Leptonema sp. (in: bacteria)]